MTTPLDPGTLRALAAELDGRAAAARRKCACAGHTLIAGQADELATDYRMRAIRIEQHRAVARHDD